MFYVQFWKLAHSPNTSPRISYRYRIWPPHPLQKVRPTSRFDVCAFTDALRHTLILTSGHLSYCCLPLSSKQPGHSPLTSDISEPFSPRELLFIRYSLFFFFEPILCKPLGMAVWENPRRILRPAHLPSTATARSKSLKSPFFTHFDARFELRQLAFAKVAAMWLAEHIIALTSSQTGVPVQWRWVYKWDINQ